MGSILRMGVKSVVASALVLTSIAVASLPAYCANSLRVGDRGTGVIRLQTLLISSGYLNTRATGYYGPSTAAAVKSFQRAKGLTADGIAGSGTQRILGVGAAVTTASSSTSVYRVAKGDNLWTIAEKVNARVADLRRMNGLSEDSVLDIGQAVKVPPAKTGSVSRGMMVKASGHAQPLSWDEVRNIYTDYAMVTDIKSGLSFRVHRRGGSEHADSEPVTAEDSATLKTIYGNKWSWDRRAVIVSVNGLRIAASINGMPHGGDLIQDNDMEGHICIHFLGSRTHGSRNVDPDHQAMIRLASHY